MKRMIRASENSEASSDREQLDEQLDELLRNMKDDFDFILSGFEKLQRSDSLTDCRDALSIAQQLYNTLQESISTISEKF